MAYGRICQPNVRRKARTLLLRFYADARGTVLVVFGLLLIVFFAFIGAAVDYVRIAAINSQIQRAADAASLAVVGSSSPVVERALALSRDGPVPDGDTLAKRWFETALGKSAKTFDAKVTADVRRQETSLNVKLTYSAMVSSGFLGVLGFRSFKVGGSSSATTELSRYMDFYLLLDNSPSMGVGATLNDINTMVSNTPDACAFACHDLSDPNNYYKLAKQLGVMTRIDVLRRATQDLMTTAEATETRPDQYRMAIYTFSRNFSRVSNLTSDLGRARVEAAAIDLETVPHQNANNDQYTDYDAALKHMKHVIPDSGTGTHNDPIQVLFFVTDGVGDSNANGVRKIAPVDPALCEAIKDKGIKIAVLYTTYLPLPTNGFYMANVDPWINAVSPTMQSCASSDLFFEVSPSEGIAEAMNALFLKIAKLPRLTQ